MLGGATNVAAVIVCGRTGKSEIYLGNDSAVNHSLSNKRLNGFGQKPHKLDTLDALHIILTRCNGKGRHIKIFHVINLGRRMGIGRQSLKVTRGKPFGEILIIENRAVDNGKSQREDITLLLGP